MRVEVLSAAAEGRARRTSGPVKMNSALGSWLGAIFLIGLDMAGVPLKWSRCDAETSGTALSVLIAGLYP